MDQVGGNLRAIAPALLFLCAGVPLAALLDRLGFFDSVAVAIQRRFAELPVAALWWLAAATTALLNLDTTVVLLTPLYIRLARRTGVDPLPLALVPLLLASLASSVLPVSNLTTLIATDRYDLGVGQVVAHLAPVSATASLVGWLAYRRRHPRRLPPSEVGEPDRTVLRIGGAVVAALLVGFVAGPAWGVPPWAVALAADVVLVVVTRWVPWREVPVRTAALVAAVAAAVAVAVPADALAGLLDRSSPAAVGAIVVGAAGAADVVNNLPALLVALDSATGPTWGFWAWLAGVNTGAVLVPLGALANLLWLRIVRDEGVDIDLRRYVSAVVPVAGPALLAAAACLGLERLLAG